MYTYKSNVYFLIITYNNTSKPPKKTLPTEP